MGGVRLELCLWRSLNRAVQECTEFKAESVLCRGALPMEMGRLCGEGGTGLKEMMEG